MMILAYDVETTGLPLWSEPSEHPDQPHLVQIAARLIDSETRSAVAAIDLTCRPVGWTIPDEVAAIHGIDTERARRAGVDELLAVQILRSLWMRAEVRLGYNESFDARMVRIALKRYIPHDGPDGQHSVADEWKDGPAICVCNLATPHCAMPATERMRATGRGGKPKRPKLTEAHEILLGTEMQDAHNAAADIDATLAVYWHLIDEGLASEPAVLAAVEEVV